MRGFAVETPQGPIRLATMRVNLDSGKINEFAIEGLDGRTPQGPVKLGRFALKSLDVANLLRLSAQFAGSPQPPSPDKVLEMIPLIGGVELKGLVVSLQKHRQAGQHRKLQPGLGAVCRADPDQGPSDRQDDVTRRCHRSLGESR